MSAAIARIELSRERLRLAMDPPPAPAAPRTERPLLDRVLAWPLLHDVLESLRHWWSVHPLRPVGAVAAEAVGAVARPVALRHPWLLVLGAAAVGGALAWGRPWRWLLRSTLFAGLVPQLASRVASSLPIESWMTTVGAMMSTPPRRRATTPTPAPPPGARATPEAPAEAAAPAFAEASVP
jgi:hypothetical protein